MKKMAFSWWGLASLCAMIVSCNNPDSVEEDDELPTKDSDTGPDLDLSRCAYGTGEYHNYFLDSGFTEEEVDDRIDTAWSLLFEGDPASETVYYEAGTNDDGPMAYIEDIANEDVRSEGMSYGMMIALQLDKQARFDALWNWAKTHMWHGSNAHPFYEYFAWNVHPDGEAHDDTPAPDGEEYFAMALYFASGRWGDGKGIYDYRAEADRLVSAMRHREDIHGWYMDRGNRAQDVGFAIVHPQYKMVRFVPKATYGTTSQGDHTDPSYHLPGFYQLWSVFGPEEDRTFWNLVADVSRDYFETVAHPETALTPDYAHYNGEPAAASWNENTAKFGPDACRTVMNWSMDWAWFCVDEREQERSDKLQRFFASLGEPYDAKYELDGTPLENNYYSPSVVAMNATSVLAATDDARSASFVEALWNLEVPSGRYRYYDGMLYMFALLHVSGRFRIYEPA